MVARDLNLTYGRSRLNIKPRYLTLTYGRTRLKLNVWSRALLNLNLSDLNFMVARDLILSR